MLVAPRAEQDLLYKDSAKFSTTHRLSRKNGFDYVVHSEYISDRHFKIYFVQNNFKNARLGMIVGKRILSNSVDRNRVKRNIRETFRQHSIKMCNLDLVVMVRRPFEQQESGELVKNLKMLFCQAEFRCAG